MKTYYAEVEITVHHTYQVRVKGETAGEAAANIKRNISYRTGKLKVTPTIQDVEPKQDGKAPQPHTYVRLEDIGLWEEGAE